MQRTRPQGLLWVFEKQGGCGAVEAACTMHTHHVGAKVETHLSCQHDRLLPAVNALSAPHDSGAPCAPVGCRPKPIAVDNGIVHGFTRERKIMGVFGAAAQVLKDVVQYVRWQGCTRGQLHLVLVHTSHNCSAQSFQNV